MEDYVQSFNNSELLSRTWVFTISNDHARVLIWHCVSFMIKIYSYFQGKFGMWCNYGCFRTEQYLLWCYIYCTAINNKMGYFCNWCSYDLVKYGMSRAPKISLNGIFPVPSVSQWTGKKEAMRNEWALRWYLVVRMEISHPYEFGNFCWLSTLREVIK